jgi:hypothetical protein
LTAIGGSSKKSENQKGGSGARPRGNQGGGKLK